ncbi:MAG: hypothetical protein NTZ65_03500 [Candidatus Berkelbacteria bacterium]|nr:hypothetical protein [Candidatus Berkelbacteria bacterium]
MYLLSFISILGWIFFLSVKFKKYASFFPFFVVTAIIFILYLAGLTGTLLVANRLLFYLGLLLPIYAIFKFKLTLKELKNLPISFFFLAISGVIWYFFTRHAVIFGWDEFCWGQFTKVIFSTNHIYTVNSAIFEGKMNYPPGISLFQYYFLPFNRYSEAALYFSQGIIILSTISIIFDFVGRSKKRLFIFVLIVSSALIYFSRGILSMTNDHIVGAIFGSAILSSLYILRSNKSKLLLIPAIFALPLIKTTGIVLSLTVVLVASVDLLILNLSLGKQKKQTKINILIPVLLIFILGFSALVSIKSWDFYLKGQGVAATSTLPSLPKVRKSFSPQASDREKLTLMNFKKAIISLPLNQQEGVLGSNYTAVRIYFNLINKINRPGLSIVTWFSIFTILFGFIFYLQQPKKRVAWVALYLSLTVGLLTYLFFHLLAYMLYFSDYEGPNLASMSRYISSYFLGLAIITIGSIAIFIKEKPDKSRPLKTVAGVIFLYLLIFHTPPLIELIAPPQMIAAPTNLTREKTKKFSDYINANTEAGSKVWLIYQNTNGWECMMVRYDIVPRRMNGGSGNWSLGEKYGPQDVWTNGMPKETWSTQLLDEKYDYVFLAKVDDNFWTHYEGLFEDPIGAKSKQLFRVQKKDNSAVLVAK